MTFAFTLSVLYIGFIPLALLLNAQTIPPLFLHLPFHIHHSITGFKAEVKTGFKILWCHQPSPGLQHPISSIVLLPPPPCSYTAT